MKLYNSPKKALQDFVPQQPDTITLYTCGPTVYDYPHVGNWSGYIYWDILVRTLEASGHHVTRVMNITDVGHLVSDGDEGEDKLEKGAKREGKSAWDVAAFYTEDFLKGIETLNLIQPSHITKATDFIPQQIELVKTLEAKGYTYTISDGVYFDTSKFPSYANFAHLNTDELKAGARVEFNPEKRHASDFALWKFTPKGQTRDMQWESPWGVGFPGWHLECSAMAMSLLGETIDIHTGGIDHIPVHHTNEIAQSEAATGKPFSHYWLHNNHLKVNGTKISKSLQNGFTLQDLQDKGFTPEDFRLFVLQSHYQTEGNFTWENLHAAHNRLASWQQVACLRWQTEQEVATPAPHLEKIAQALADNLDTPKAIQLCDQLFDHLQNNPHLILAGITKLDGLLGLRIAARTPDITHEQKELIMKRQAAREEKAWDASDALRDQLATQGVGVNDHSSGATWYHL